MPTGLVLIIILILVMTVLRGLLMIVPVMVIAAGRLGLVMDMVTVKILIILVVTYPVIIMMEGIVLEDLSVI